MIQSRTFWRVHSRTICDGVAFLGGGSIVIVLFWITLTKLAPDNFRPLQDLDAFNVWDQLFIFYSLAYGLIVIITKLGKIPTKLHLAFIGILFTLLSIIALAIQPINSQDVYWSLLLSKGWTQYHLNPYQTTPNQLEFDNWSSIVMAWRNLPMTYGPLSVMFHGLATIHASSIGVALVRIKIISWLTLLLSGVFLWKITHNAKTLALFLFNPFILQMALVDVHNDVFIMCGIVGSYYFFMIKKYRISLLMLIVAGLVKYVSWFLLPIPLYYWLKQETKFSRRLIIIFCTVLASAVITIIAFAPFGINLDNLNGIAKVVTKSRDEATLGAYWLSAVFHLSISQIRLVGLVAGVLIMWLYIKLQKPILAYVVPFIVIWLLGTTWFQPWYVLWILPLVIVCFSESVVVIVTAILLLASIRLLPPLEMSIVLIVAFGIWWCLRKAVRIWYSWKASHTTGGD